IPKPVKLEVRSGTFKLSNSTKIIANADAQPIGQYLSAILTRTFKLPSLAVEQTPQSSGTGNITITVTPDSHIDSEGYKLDISPDAIQISASSAAGAFYAVQTLQQLIQPDDSTSVTVAPHWTVPCLSIEDQPRFKWRGLMLDVSRHFFTVHEVKHFLDLMA